MPCTDAEVSRDVQALWDMGYFEDIQVEAARVEATAWRRLSRQGAPRHRRGHLRRQRRDRRRATSTRRSRSSRARCCPSPTSASSSTTSAKLYAEKGFFLAEVSYELSRARTTRSTVRFVIDEGDEVTVRRIRFIGNDHLPDADLRAVMQTSETGFLSFLSSNNTYRKEIFDEDVNRLQALYYDYGYLTVEMADAAHRAHARPPPHRHHDRRSTRARASRSAASRRWRSTPTARRSSRWPGRKQLRESVDAQPGRLVQPLGHRQGPAGHHALLPRPRLRAASRSRPQTDLHMDTRIVDVVVAIRRGPLVLHRAHQHQGQHQDPRRGAAPRGAHRRGRARTARPWSSARRSA